MGLNDDEFILRRGYQQVPIGGNSYLKNRLIFENQQYTAAKLRQEEKIRIEPFIKPLNVTPPQVDLFQNKKPKTKEINWLNLGKK